MTREWGDSPALVVVDVTRKRADPALDTAKPAIVAAAERIADLLAVARDHDVPVFFTRGGKSYYTSGGADLADDERGPWPMQTDIREETPEQARVAMEPPPQYAVHEDEPLVTKRTPSAFYDSPLPDMLEERGVDTVVITGVVTSCCVRASVTDAFAGGYRVVLPEDCVADRRPAAHAFHMAEMDEKFADVAPAATVAEYLADSRHA
jgi:nicotinamidase-related amidase